MKGIVIAALHAYQALLSPILPFNQCRFYPSCSQYAIETVEKWGIGKGLILGIKRIVKCHPFHRSGGYDPVP
jgi:putative membrane protein insertion efficiency factor